MVTDRHFCSSAQQITRQLVAIAGVLLAGGAYTVVEFRPHRRFT
ncbi:hypothetical protein C4K02_3756 [Pseudomonas synxantha]|nr:hypothetical protein C4K02_3756 [Pseudomonas synxantha]